MFLPPKNPDTSDKGRVDLRLLRSSVSTKESLSKHEAELKGSSIAGGNSEILLSNGPRPVSKLEGPNLRSVRRNVPDSLVMIGKAMDASDTVYDFSGVSS